MIDNKHISFIGAGSMAESIIGGLLDEKLVSSDYITVTNHSKEQRLVDMEKNYGVNTTSTPMEAAKKADIIILAVKPKHIEEALASITGEITENKLVLSVLAGITTSYIESLLENEVPVVRVMPNTSAKVGASATALSSGYFAAKSYGSSSCFIFCHRYRHDSRGISFRCCNRHFRKRSRLFLLFRRSDE
ncbi:pyrroline-5-carboxylate reductase family protein [Salibacterium salarium]|uniref:pyrroline-5-carboxylate reductase family protein n=1 Tax=Salibacterium salarium TaxID=284579 RepID=UPI001FE7D91E|nr:NAD(P)-binding domain-containing protein [Salibacterium salarium]